MFQRSVFTLEDCDFVPNSYKSTEEYKIRLLETIIQFNFLSLRETID